MVNRLEFRNGQGPVIVAEEIDRLNPVKITYIWPIPGAGNLPAGEAYDCHDGAYRIKDGFGIWRIVYLPDGGATKALEIIKEPIAPPARVKLPLRWRDGHWQKLTKRAWVAA